MTKRHLYIFNPEHDLALASGETNYMPPASARRMAEELALLPVWYACEGSAVLASSAYNLDFLYEIRESLPLLVELMTEPEVAECPDIKPSPWGWNPALRRRLLQLGISDALLPSLERLEELRDLSHRKQAVDLLPYLLLNEYFCGESVYLTDMEVCRRFVESRSNSLLKAPLSGSGKGLNWCKGTFTTFISGWCNRIIRSQGGVVGEPVFNKVLDFAMEFHSDGKGGVSFMGYSVFSTHTSGAYEGNLLLPDAGIRRRLSTFVPAWSLDELRLVLEKELSQRIGFSYSGYLGVDMMICQFPDSAPEFRIHPCVEINLRMNMGVIAHFLTERLLAPGTNGRFAITYHPLPGEALALNERMKSDHPLHLENNRILSGYLPLIPVTRRNIYRAYILVE